MGCGLCKCPVHRRPWYFCMHGKLCSNRGAAWPASTCERISATEHKVCRGRELSGRQHLSRPAMQEPVLVRIDAAVAL